MDSRGYITVNASQVLAKWDLSFGLITDWGFKVLKLEGGASPGAGYDTGPVQYQVMHVISPNLMAAFGIAGVAEIGVNVPFHIVLGDADPDFIGNVADPRDNDAFRFSAQGIGDIGLHLKIRLLDTSRHPFGLALMGSVYIPTGYDTLSWLGDNKVYGRAGLILDKEFR